MDRPARERTGVLRFGAGALVTALADLLAACLQVQSDRNAAKSTKAMAAALGKWAGSIDAPAPVPTPAPSAPDTGTVLFADDFAGPTLGAQWDVKDRLNPYSGTTYIPANVSVHDGLLDIVATRDTSGAWFGGEIQGLAPGAQYVGPHYSECRAKLPAGAGVWSAPLWERDAPWGSLGIENDVNEQLGREPGRYHVTVHNGPSESFGKVVDTGLDLSADFHVYGSAMYPDHADYWFDGRLMATITAAESGLSAWKFTTTPTVALVDLDMGGPWAGPIGVTPPVHLLVDYVRVSAL